MSFKVLSEVALLNELFVALRTLVGLNVLMHSNMIQEVACFIELFITPSILAHVGIRDFLVHGVFMLDSLMQVWFEEVDVLIIFRQLQ